mgnify:CR=1 FL=1
MKTTSKILVVILVMLGLLIGLSEAEVKAQADVTTPQYYAVGGEVLTSEIVSPLLPLIAGLVAIVLAVLLLYIKK